MKKITLDFKDLYTPRQMHEYIAQMLEFPEYYGKNLDALHDCLTDLSRNVWVILINGDFLDDALGDYAKKLRRVFTDVGNLPYACHFVEHRS